MKFLLIAPVLARSQESSTEAVPQDHDPMEQLLSRNTSRVKLLAQDWTDLNIDTTSPKTTNCGIFNLDSAGYCVADGRAFYSLLVSSPSLLGPSSVVSDLEGCLSQAGKHWISQLSVEERTEVPWIARYALLKDKQDLPVNWLDSSVRFTDITSETSSSNRSQVEVALGWGNGCVIGWDHIGKTAEEKIVEGLIDAQLIWADLQVLLTTNEEIFDRILAPTERRQKQFVRRLHADRSTLEIAASRHHLLFDELIQGVQGTRRKCAELLLDSWMYDRAAQRMLERTKDTAVHVDNLRAKSESRYQSAVQTMLIALGFLAILDTALGILSTAFSGDVAQAPHGRLGFFEALRNLDSDWLFAITLLITALLTMLFVRKRR